jgi:hypothetical protein
MSSRRSAALVALATLLAGEARAEEPPVVTPPGYKDRSGVGLLALNQSLNGYLFGYLFGLTVADLGSSELDDEEGLRVAGGALLGLGVGLGASLIATRGREVRSGDALLIGFGSMQLGMGHGLLIPFIAGADTPRAYGLSGMAGDLLGLGGAILVTTQVKFTPGEAALFSYFHGHGFLMGLFIAAAGLDPEDEDDWRPAVAVGLAMGDAALAGSYLGRRSLEMDRRRVQWLELGSLIGGLSGLGLGWVIDPDATAPMLAGLSAGIPVGGLVAYLVTDDLDRYKRRFDPGAPVARLGVPRLRVDLLPPVAPGDRAAPRIGLDLEGSF